MKLTHGIGRGFVACFLHNSGYEVVFADVAEPLVNALNKEPSYKVIEVGEDGTSENTITNYRAVNSRTQEAELVDEIASADIVTCSVGPNILKFIAPVIAKGIDARPSNMNPMAVIACENAIGATDTLAKFITEPKNMAEDRVKSISERARFANSAIDRIVPAQDPDAGLDVKLEKFYEWVVDRTPFAPYNPPAIEGVNWVDNLEPFIERKLFTVNTGHATAAYHGYNEGKSTVYDALNDHGIKNHVRKTLDHTSNLIVDKHGICPNAQKKYVDNIIRRISNPHLEDAVERVGRAPLRKLSRRERFIGPAAELAERDQDVSGLLRGIEMAFRFQNVEGDEESKELANIMSENTADEVVSQVCGLKSEEKLYPMVLEIVKNVQADME